ncbi:MAG: MarR family winged helix-turn-helix transcriptional regulator [Phycisphaerae bacterium]
MGSNSSASAKTVDGLLKAMLVFSRTVEHSLETNAVACAVGEPLSSSKVQILRLLGQGGSQTASQIARYLGVSKPAVSQIVDAMVRGRLVSRRAAREDRREVNLSLTAKGKRFARNMQQQQRRFVKDALRQSRGFQADRWLKSLREATEGLAKADRTFSHYCLQCPAYGDTACVLVGGNADCGYLQQDAKAQKRAEARRGR